MKLSKECMEVREEFSALLDDELSTDERERVESHLTDCSECLRELDAMKQVGVAYAGLPRVDAPAGFEAGVNTALRPGSARRARRRVVWLGPLAAAAAITMVVFIGREKPQYDEFQMASETVLEKASESLVMDISNAPQPAAVPETVGGLVRQRAVESQDKEEALADEGAWESLVSADALAEAEAPAEPKKTEVAEQFAAAPAASAPEPASEEESDRLKSLGYVGAGREDADAQARRNVVGDPESSFKDDVALDELEVDNRDGEFRSRGAGAGGVEAGPDFNRIARESAPLRKISLRSFSVRDGVWIERGYAGEPTTELKRDSDALRELVRRYPDVEQIVKRSARSIFVAGERWYGLEAVEESP